MSIGPAIARQVARPAPQGREVEVARVLIVRDVRDHWINEWWVNANPFEPPLVGNTEKRRASLETYKVLRFDLCAIARRFAEVDANPTAGGSTAARAQAKPETLPENPRIPENRGSLSLGLALGLALELALVLDGMPAGRASPEGPALIAEIAEITKAQQIGHRMAARLRARNSRKSRKSRRAGSLPSTSLRAGATLGLKVVPSKD